MEAKAGGEGGKGERGVLHNDPGKVWSRGKEVLRTRVPEGECRHGSSTPLDKLENRMQVRQGAYAAPPPQGVPFVSGSREQVCLFKEVLPTALKIKDKDESNFLHTWSLHLPFGSPGQHPLLGILLLQLPYQ